MSHKSLLGKGSSQREARLNPERSRNLSTWGWTAGGAFFRVECRQRLTGVVGEGSQDSAERPCLTDDVSEFTPSLQIHLSQDRRERAAQRGGQVRGTIRNRERMESPKSVVWEKQPAAWAAWDRPRRNLSAYGAFPFTKCFFPPQFSHLSRTEKHLLPQAEPHGGRVWALRELPQLRSCLANLGGVVGVKPWTQHLWDNKEKIEAFLTSTPSSV